VVLLTIDLPEMVLTSALGAALMAAFVIALKIDIREE
jgi:hypothetical protein